MQNNMNAGGSAPRRPDKQMGNRASREESSDDYTFAPQEDMRAAKRQASKRRRQENVRAIRRDADS